GVAGQVELYGDRHLGPAERVLERDAHVALDVVAPLPARLLLRASPAIEQPAEDVAEIEVAEVERRAARRTAEPAVRRPDGVVLLALLRVGEHVVRRLHLLEALLIAWVPVGVHLADELAVRLLQLVGGRRLRDA